LNHEGFHNTHFCSIWYDVILRWLNYSTNSNLLPFTTAPSGPPMDITHLAITSTFITLSWNPPEASLQNGVIRSYIVSIQEEDTGRNFTRDSTNTELNVGNLHPFYFYHFAVAAVTTSQGPFANEYILQTLEDGKYMIISLLGTRNNIHKGITTLDAFSEIGGPISCKE